MRTFSILTLGCKVNQYESAQIRQFLEENGLFSVLPSEKPDVFVINTCCVTATASAKSRQFIQRARRLNGQAEIVVCGCLTAQQTPRKGQPGELCLTKDTAIHLTAGKDMLAYELTQIIGGPRLGNSLTNTANIAAHPLIEPKIDSKIKSNTGLARLPKLPLLTSFKEQTRAFLKVQDGCDGVCSYCIIPKVRPEVRNKPVFEAVNEAKALVAAGHKEIVVTGVCLSAYGRQTTRRTEDRRQKTEEKGRIADLATEGTENLATEHTETTEKRNKESIEGLLGKLAGVEGLRRLRASSLAPEDISNQLLDVFCAHSNIMPHIHLSVQSGADNILRRMCRPYGAGELREKIELIKSRLDRPAITCDIIVGFPGETEEDFKETVELAKWAGFSKMHIFPFSARAGTSAAKMKDRVQPKVVKMRAEILRGLSDELGYEFRKKFIGESCETLIENTNPLSGLSERYFTVQVQTNGQKLEKNQIVKVQIVNNGLDGAMGITIRD